MLTVSTGALLGRALFAALLAVSLTAASTNDVVFTAPEPGARLAPVGNAADLVRLTQGQASLLFASATGNIETVTVTGWPTGDGEHDLGGAMLVETVYRDAGAVSFGEAPQSVEFKLSG